MQAAVLYGKEDLRLETVPRPRAAAGEIVLQVGAALTCGTDLKVFRRGYHARMLKPPIPFGHEIAGVVAEAGEGSTFRVGDRVVALNSAPCGQCFFCRRDQANLCNDLLFNNGAYAEFLRVPARIAGKNTLRVPDYLPLEHAALTEPLACVMLGLEEANARPGDTLAVIGCGPIGLLFVHAAALSGMHVIAIAKHREQAAIAKELGAAEIVMLERDQSPVNAVRALTEESRGVDIAIEAVASPTTWGWAVDMARKGGTVNFFGGPPAGTQVQLDTNQLHYSGLSLRASFHHTPRTVRRAFALLAGGRFQTRQFLTARASLGDVVSLYRTMSSGATRGIKTVILP
ncbi:alcohol dehydrogenase [Acidipila sp. EB88]|nr:alcohol dehydrogenase [Acidipila sp. EB88]